ncbi:hypothetical protein PFISCL1PPCAC_14418, partial [Pristionchus fissidentatus]
SFDRCKSLVFSLPHEDAIYDYLEKISESYDDFFVCFILIAAPILLIVNITVIFILTKRELRSPYNAVFVVMAIDQSFSIVNMS